MQDSAGPAGPGFGPEDLLEIVERRKWWLVLGALGGLALGVVAYFVLPPSYTASTSVLVEPQRVPEDYIRPTVTLEVERRLDTLRERVTSHVKLNELIDAIGPGRLDPGGRAGREEIMRKIRGNLEVELGAGRRSAEKAAVFQISYTDRDPEVAADVVRLVADLFITENIKDRALQARATEEFLDRELERIREAVAAKEEELRKFKEARMGALPSQLDANLQTLSRLNDQLSSNLEAQTAIAQRITLLRSQLEGVAVPGTGTPMTPAIQDPLSQALVQARQALIEARRVYTEEHPNVKTLEEEVARLEEQIRNRPPPSEDPASTAVANPVVANLRAQIAAAEAELATRRQQEQRLRAQIADYEARVEEAPRLEQQELALTRDYDNLVASYQDLLAKKTQAALARNLEQSQKGERFKVLRPARVPEKPTWPALHLLAPGGLLLGLALAAGLVLLQELRHPAFRSVSRLSRQLGLPVVASVPRIDNDRIYEEAPSGEVDPRLVVFTAPESAPAEQYRSFAPLFLDHEDRKVVLVTSAARGDGKSLTTLNLALTIACDLNRRVLVIDGDLRRPTAHRLLHVEGKRGLTDVLRREAPLEACAVNSKIPNLTLLPAGRPARNPLALLTDAAFLELLQWARGHYDAVFIDSPPLLPVVDTRLLRRMADLVLLVVRADATPRDAVVRSMQELKDVAGVVFNQVSPNSFRRYYYHDPYARYAYGDPPEDASDRGPA